MSKDTKHNADADLTDTKLGEDDIPTLEDSVELPADAAGAFAIKVDYSVTPPRPERVSAPTDSPPAAAESPAPAPPAPPPAPDLPHDLAEFEDLVLMEQARLAKQLSAPGGTKTNPFLPPHILERLKSGRHLVEEIAQTGTTFDANAAMLRTKARAERVQRGGGDQVQVTGSSARAERERARLRQQLVDDLVDEYLPLITAELRRRLQRLLGD